MKEWLSDPEWIIQYSSGVALLKKSAILTDKELDEVRDSIKNTFRRVYRAVAFDIDGTITPKGSIHVDQEMAKAVGRLLRRGVPVVLVTGRGRPSARQAAQEIKSFSQLSDWHMRRLQCVTHNGTFIIETPTNNPSSFLTVERVISELYFSKDLLVTKIQQAIAVSGVDITTVTVDQEPHSIRIKFLSEQDRTSVRSFLEKIVTDLTTSENPLYLCLGAYENLSCVDLVGTNKKQALSIVAKKWGIAPDKILRLGDQGQEEGNDYDLLKSSSGFSVGEFSSDLERCLPVLAEDNRTQLIGAEAAVRLMKLVRLFPPLSISSSQGAERIASLRSFEKIAISRSRRAVDEATEKLRESIKSLIADGEAFIDIDSLQISDIYDPLSGGVRFRDWEFDQLPSSHLAFGLFGIPFPSLNTSEPSKWCMFTDTAILMRGPDYYFGYTRSIEERNLNSYMVIAEEFVRGAILLTNFMSNEKPCLTRYKLFLAIQDNIRNIILKIFYISFLTESEMIASDYVHTRTLFLKAVLPHTEIQLNFLFDKGLTWRNSLIDYASFIDSLLKYAIVLKNKMIVKSDNFLIKETKLFKWRECDHFLQNVMAVRHGIKGLKDTQDIEHQNIAFVGLAHGGIELPAIASVIAKSEGLNSTAGIAKVSIYGNKDYGEMVRAGDEEYVVRLLTEKKPFCMMELPESSSEEPAIILMDDNCTTCVTLQLARDFLVSLGADVVGAIVVRFPGVNRYVHMSLPGHGFPDPEILFSFIQGLIAPSPYARLVCPGNGNPYQDQTATFDKAEARIERYLLKNGTPRLIDKLSS